MLSLSKDSDHSPSFKADDNENSVNVPVVTDRDHQDTSTNENQSDNEDDWGIVMSATSASSPAESTRPGILILSGDDEPPSSSPQSSSSDNIQPILTALSSPIESDTTYLIENMSEQDADTISHHAEELGSSSSIPSEIPSTLDSLSHPLEVSANLSTVVHRDATPYRSGPTMTTSDPTYESFSYHDQDDRESQGQSESLRMLSDELAVVEAIFSSNKARILNPCTLLVVSLVILSCFATFFVVERRAWQASSRRLEERIEQLQLELIRKLDSEKQHMLEFADLKQELKQVFQNREAINPTLQGEAKQDPKPPRAPHESCPPQLDWDIDSGDEEENLHFENCWIQAEAKLGECAREAKNAVRSKFQTLGHSLWNVQEHVFEKVTDFGKRVQTVAKEAAERVVREAEQLENESKYEKSKDHNETALTNFRSITTTLVSGVAFASLAGLVVDQASEYIAGLGEDSND